jgi:hypothetical protein
MPRRRRFALLAIVTGMFTFFGMAVGHLRPAPPSVSCEGDLWTEAAKRGPMVFKFVDGGEQAVRVTVKFGRASVNTIEVLDGLKEGDKIIPSDMNA